MNCQRVLESVMGPICIWMILNSTVALRMLRIENASDNAPVVGNITIVPLRKSVYWKVPVAFHGLGTLPLTINQTYDQKCTIKVVDFCKTGVLILSRCEIPQKSR